jgi:hypothetical protein
VYDNTWAANFKTRDDNRISNRLTANMVPVNDPRIKVFAQPAESDSSFTGLENALTQAQASAFITTTSRPGAIFFPGATSYGTFGGAGASFPQFMMVFAEVLLLQAEAVERGFMPGSAAALYTQAIQASMAQWGVTDNAAIAAYLAQPAIAYQGGTPGLTQIAIQKWIALFADGGQAWAEWRRTCQPSNIRPGPSAITNEVIRRFQYSITENEVNAEAVAAAIAQQGPDNFLTRVFWDTKPTAAPTFVAGCGIKP